MINLLKDSNQSGEILLFTQLGECLHILVMSAPTFLSFRRLSLFPVILLWSLCSHILSTSLVVHRRFIAEGKISNEEATRIMKSKLGGERVQVTLFMLGLEMTIMFSGSIFR